jgi:hypothetical protein
MRTHFLLALALILAAFHLEAATITPAAPTEQDVITATIVVPGTILYDTPSTSVNSHIIRTDLPVISVIAGPPVFTALEFASFGPLPQGTYTYQVYQVYQGQSELISQQTIVVAPPIPTMSNLGLSILGTTLAAIAGLTLSKRNV